MARPKAKPKGIRDRIARAEAAVAAKANEQHDVDAGVEDAVLGGLVDLDEPNVVKSCIKMKLASFVPDPRIRRLIGKVVADVNVVLAEAYAYANYHVTSVLEAGQDVACVGPKFYDRCIAAVANCGKTRAKGDPYSMDTTAAAFCGLRPAENAPIDFGLLGDIRSELVIAMGAMAVNHLRTNFKARLDKYVAWRHSELPKSLRAAVAKHVATFPTVRLDRVPALARVDQDGRPLGADRLRHVDAARELITALRAECPLTKDVTTLGADKVTRLLPVLYRVMRETEAAYAATKAAVDAGAADAAPRLRRLTKARFALLPYKAGFTTSHVPICSRAWVGLLRRITNDDGTPVVKWTTNRLDVNGHDACWRRACHVSAFETRTRRFGGRIATDGVSVTVVLDKTQAALTPVPTGPVDTETLDALRKQRPLNFAGVDPGLSDIVTVVDELSGQARSYSGSRYYEAAKVKVSNQRTNKWNKETADSAARIDRAADMSTASSPFFATYLAEVRGLLRHRAERGYRNMRFMRYVFKQRAVSDICDLIAAPEQFTVVGFGNWAGPNGSPIRRRFCGPLQDIKRELVRRTSSALIRSVDEYRTSKVCHVTRTELVNMKATSVRYDRRTRSMVTRPHGRVHKVLHCLSSNAAPGRHGGTWNRDVNAARNMLLLVKLEVSGAARPAEFARGGQAGQRR